MREGLRLDEPWLMALRQTISGKLFAVGPSDFVGGISTGPGDHVVFLVALLLLCTSELWTNPHSERHHPLPASWAAVT